MNEKEIEKLQSLIIENLGNRIECEMEKKTKRGFMWIQILNGSLITLFIIFVSLSIGTIKELSKFREDVNIVITELRTKEDKNAENTKNLAESIVKLRIEIAIPIQLALAKANMVQALQEKNMNAFYKYSDMVTNLELELLKLKYPQEQTRGK
ncbi:MAG TPA: hypothetical protein VGB37_12650 [Candidatus Lokiarchaeia archaeon]